jgi:hypothetical protein
MRCTKHWKQKRAERVNKKETNAQERKNKFSRLVQRPHKINSSDSIQEAK